jgi:hypothetical protein
MLTCRSYAEAYAHRATAVRLLLRASPDVACANLMCEHVGGGCACRLSLALERMPLLEHIDVRGNGLPALPAPIFAPPRLRVLRAAGNALRALPLPPAAAAACAQLAALDLAGNALQELPLEALAALPALRWLHVAGNPLSPRAAAALAAHPRLWRAAQDGESWAAQAEAQEPELL